MKKHIIFRCFKKILKQPIYSDEFVQYWDQEANDYIYHRIVDSNEGLMINKFGTTELDNICCYLIKQSKIGIRGFIGALKGQYSFYEDAALENLCKLSGFFPSEIDYWYKYGEIAMKDLSEIDILASYLKPESIVQPYMNCETVNLDGFYAPFMWDNPWTKALKGKRVLVIHPFVETIEKQYEKRNLLFENSEVLPEFSNLFLIKAVQSIADNASTINFASWFEALEFMEEKIDKIEFDVALIGCGAYGMELAAYVKRKGKIAVQLAGWTQMLFGIYGKRWIEDQPQYSKYINENWVRPSENERPKGYIKVEGGAYW